MSSRDPDLDRVLHALSHQYRRRTIRHLERHDDPLTIENLAAVLADYEPTQHVRSSHSRLVIALTHKHIPVLVDAALVERTSRDRVVATDAATAAVDVLDAATDAFD